MAIYKMKIISKEKAWFGFDINGKFYCFEERKCNYTVSAHNELKLLSDITVNEYNQLHSFNDESALIYIDKLNRIVKLWFINGYSKRLNQEKPRLIIKGCGYYLNNGKAIFKKNIR